MPSLQTEDQHWGLAGERDIPGEGSGCSQECEARRVAQREETKTTKSMMTYVKDRNSGASDAGDSYPKEVTIYAAIAHSQRVRQQLERQTQEARNAVKGKDTVYEINRLVF